MSLNGSLQNSLSVDKLENLTIRNLVRSHQALCNINESICDLVQQQILTSICDIYVLTILNIYVFFKKNIYKDFLLISIYIFHIGEFCFLLWIVIEEAVSIKKFGELNRGKQRKFSSYLKEKLHLYNYILIFSLF